MNFIKCKGELKMSLLNKEKKDNEEIAKVEYDLQGMTYEEFIHKELNDKLSELREKEKKATNAINELYKELEVKGSDRAGLENIISNITEKHKEIMKEIGDVKNEYEVDLNLILYASKLDKADSNNRGIDLIMNVIPKINEIRDMIPEIVNCYKNEYYFPGAVSVIKNSMDSLVGQLNRVLPELKRIDKEGTLKAFNERLAEIENKKKEKRLTKEKYTDLLI